MFEQPRKSRFLDNLMTGKTFRLTEVSLASDKLLSVRTQEADVKPLKKKPMKILSDITSFNVAKQEVKPKVYFLPEGLIPKSKQNKQKEQMDTEPTLENLRNHVKKKIGSTSRTVNSTTNMTGTNFYQGVTTDTPKAKTSSKKVPASLVGESPKFSTPTQPYFLSDRRMSERVGEIQTNCSAFRPAGCSSEAKIGARSGSDASPGVKTSKSQKSHLIKRVNGVEVKEYLQDWCERLQKTLYPSQNVNDQTITGIGNSKYHWEKGKSAASPSNYFSGPRNKKEISLPQTIELPSDLFVVTKKPRSDPLRSLKRSNSSSGVELAPNLTILEKQSAMNAAKQQATKDLKDLTISEETQIEGLEPPAAQRDFMLKSLFTSKKKTGNLALLQLPNATVEVCTSHETKYLKVIPQDLEKPRRMWSPRLQPQSTLNFLSYEPRAYALCKAVLDQIKLLKSMNCDDSLILAECLEECSKDSIIISLLFGGPCSNSLQTNLQQLFKLAERNGRSRSKESCPVSLLDIGKSRRQCIAEISRSNVGSSKRSSQKLVLDVADLKSDSLDTLRKVLTRFKKLSFQIYSQSLVQELKEAYRIHQKLMFSSFETEKLNLPIVPIRNCSELLDQALETSPKPVFLQAEKRRRGLLSQRSQNIALSILQAAINREAAKEEPRTAAIARMTAKLIDKGVGTNPWSEEDIIFLENKHQAALSVV